MAIIQFNVDQEAAAKAAAGERAGRGVLPEGQYVLRVTSSKLEPGKTPASYPALVCKCEVLWSFNANNVGRTITRRFRMTPKAIPYFFLPFCAAAGIPVQQGPQGVQFDDASINGATTKAKCTHSPGERQTFEDWSDDESVQNGGAAQPQPQAWAPPAQQPVAQPAQWASQPMQQAPTPAWAPPAAAQPQGPPSPPWGQLPPRGQG